MGDGQRHSLEATALVRWLLEAGVGGLGLTKTHALQRVVVREAAERWPHWWNHELFGPLHREAELPVLAAAHEGLRRLRLLRRQRETLRTTTRGRQLLLDPDALLAALHGDMGAQERFLRGRLAAGGGGATRSRAPRRARSDRDRKAAAAPTGLARRGGRPFDEHSLWHALHPLLSQAEGYGLVQRSRGTERLALELTAAGRRLATGGPPAPTIPTTLGDAALIFDAELLNARGVRRAWPSSSVSI